MSEINKERLLQQTTCAVVEYNSPEEALAKYGELSLTIKNQMAQIYREAFQGKPWFEINECPDHGGQQGSCCAECGKMDLPPSYQTPQLVNEAFPKMVSNFVPGVLVIAKNQERGVVGFCCGGMTTLEKLVQEKYRGDQSATIKQSIADITGLTSQQPFFYQDEMCVPPPLQELGLGSLMDRTRLDWIDNRNINTVYGRSINPNLLGMKLRHMPRRGFSITFFRPKGDTYEVEGNPRLGYFAQR